MLLDHIMTQRAYVLPLPSCVSDTKWNLKNIGIGDAQVMLIAMMLGFQDSVDEPLIPGLARDSALTLIDLSNNNIHGEAAAFLCKYLKNTLTICS